VINDGTSSRVSQGCRNRLSDGRGTTHLLASLSADQYSCRLHTANCNGARRVGAPARCLDYPLRRAVSRSVKQDEHPATPDETIEITILKHNGELEGFNQWLLNGVAFSMETMKPAYTVKQGRRYGLKFRNASDDIHPLHLHRHSFELVGVGGKPTAGVIKDVVMLGGFQEVEFDFVANNPGPTLFHCHQQLHMDFGFMAMFNYE
jgi:FtsP/CotA-like multicopper oxidase with cupredoxin domain